jgi:hypothetical protein
MTTFDEIGIEIKLPDNDTFLKVKETLTRIGIKSVKNTTLYQSCHILHKKGRYKIVHFKELFALDRKVADFTSEDQSRRNRIVKLLEDWKLVEIVDDMTEKELAPIHKVNIISFTEKPKWNLLPKYNIGKFRKEATDNGE